MSIYTSFVCLISFGRRGGGYVWNHLSLPIWNWPSPDTGQYFIKLIQSTHKIFIHTPCLFISCACEKDPVMIESSAPNQFHKIFTQHLFFHLSHFLFRLFIIQFCLRQKTGRVTCRRVRWHYRWGKHCSDTTHHQINLPLSCLACCVRYVYQVVKVISSWWSRDVIAYKWR